MDMDIVNQNLSKAGAKSLGKKAGNALREKELKDACAGFEAILMSKMIKSMRRTLPGNALFKESNRMNIYQSMHDRYLSDQLSMESGSLGIRDFLFNQLKDSL